MWNLFKRSNEWTGSDRVPAPHRGQVLEVSASVRRTDLTLFLYYWWRRRVEQRDQAARHLLPRWLKWQWRDTAGRHRENLNHTELETELSHRKKKSVLRARHRLSLPREVRHVTPAIPGPLDHSVLAFVPAHGDHAVGWLTRLTTDLQVQTGELKWFLSNNKCSGPSILISTHQKTNKEKYNVSSFKRS